MHFTPQSWGSPLREFNPCHSPADGKFTVKGQGRCLGAAARVAARQAYDRQSGPGGFHQASDPAMLLGQRALLPRSHDWQLSQARARRQLSQGDIGMAVAHRQLARTNAAGPLAVPGFFRKDLRTARRTDSALAMFIPSSPDEPRNSSSAFSSARVAIIHPGSEENRPDVLTSLRHELGHLDRTPLGSGGLRLAGVRLPPRIAEEVRAWKNAIRNSGGKVKSSVIRQALGTYVLGDQLKGLGFSSERRRALAQQRADAIMVRVMPVFDRYKRRIRRASRGLV